MPKALCQVLEQLPANSHPMDVLRTGVSALGTLEPETASFEAIHVGNSVLAKLVVC